MRLTEELRTPQIYDLQQHGITRRECDVMYWLIQGKRYADVAVILGSAVRTVSTQVASLRKKLGASSTVSASRIADEWLRAGRSDL